jgi:Na+-transporting NADH:ubiquinone oxidoreductase subunit NqrB
LTPPQNVARIASTNSTSNTKTAVSQWWLGLLIGLLPILIEHPLPALIIVDAVLHVVEPDVFMDLSKR